jgi:tetratricopeptide (TPR) repeat protein
MAQWRDREEKSLAEHPTPDDLARFVAGTLPRPDCRRLVGHLLRGCPACALALAREGGLHPAEVPEDAYDEVVTSAAGRAMEAAAQRQEAVAILTALLSGERSWAGLSGGELATLRGLPRVKALLEAGRSLRYQDPQATLRFASLARHAAERLSPKQFGDRPLADLKALAWAELANAYRICDDLSAASQAMNRAIHWSHRGSRSSLLLARIADLLASLLGAQRRVQEALELLFLVFKAHRRDGRHHLAGRALFSAGNMAALEGAPNQGILLMHRALGLLDQERDPVLVAHLLLSMIMYLTDMGRFRSARRHLWRCRHLFLEYGNEVDQLRLRWLEGRIYAGLGELSRSEAALQATRQGFADHGQVYPAALAGLDLATLWARQGRHREIHALAQEMIATFRALRIAREAIVTLLILQKACLNGGGQLLEIIEMVMTFLKDLERQPAKRLEASPAPPAAL